MKSILEMFLSEAKKDPNSTKDGEEQDDVDVNEDETKDDGDMEDDTDQPSDDPIDSDDVEGDELFSDVENDDETDTEENNNDTDTLDDDETNTDNNEDDSNSDDTSDEMSDDETDSTDDSDDEFSNNDDVDSEEDGSSEEDNEAKIKNKKLLTDFVNLHNEVKTMSNDLTNYSTDNKVQFLTITRMAENLEELAYSINDYIRIRFSTKSYEENLLMYQKIVDSIKISDEIISKIIENRNNH